MWDYGEGGPLTRWAEEHLDGDDYVATFGEVEE